MPTTKPNTTAERRERRAPDDYLNDAQDDAERRERKAPTTGPPTNSGRPRAEGRSGAAKTEQPQTRTPHPDTPAAPPRRAGPSARRRRGGSAAPIAAGGGGGGTLLVAPANTVEHGYNPARAITLATGVLKPGDAILIEQQTDACGGVCDDTQQGCGPIEWHQSVFDAIAAATALGIVVVEPAGNGNVNLDDPSCGGVFDRNVRELGSNHRWCGGLGNARSVGILVVWQSCRRARLGK